MTEMIPTSINDRWSLLLPAHRAGRYSWSWWEATRLACMHHYLGDGGHVVWDVGAEEGDFPALWASWGNDVVLFEGNARVWPNIKAIFDANELVPLATFPGFAADQDGRDGDRHDAEHVGWRGGPLWPTSANGPVISDHGFCNLSERPDIPRLRIDTLASAAVPGAGDPEDPGSYRGLGAPDALTIDVEGSELRVLWGAKETLASARPLVWVSIHPEFMADMYGDSPDDLHALFDALGYERTFLTRDHEEHWFMWPAERKLFMQ